MKPRSRKKFAALDAFAFIAGKPDAFDMLTPEFDDLPDERLSVNTAPADGVDGVQSFGFSRYRRYRPHLPEHTHPECFEINFCRRGVLVFESAGTAHAVKPGHIFISKPDEPHHLTTNINGLSLYWMLVKFPPEGGTPLLGLTATEANALRRKLSGIGSPCFPVQDDVRILFREMFAAYKMPKKDPFRSVRLKSAALRILLSVIRDSGDRPRKTFMNAIVRTARQISEHPEMRYTLADLARQANLSLNRFSTLFKQATGLPPHKMIVLQRLKKARELLLETSTPIAEIAYSLGFASPRHFAGEFKRTFGTCARAVRSLRHCANPDGREGIGAVRDGASTPERSNVRTHSESQSGTTPNRRSGSVTNARPAARGCGSKSSGSSETTPS